MRSGYKAFGECVPSIAIVYLQHQVFLALCIVYCVTGIRSVVYWV